MSQLNTGIERDIAPSAGTVDMKLEDVVIPVSDVDRAKRFYSNLGWRLDADFVKGDAFRGVQFTPPGSSCSIHFGKGITSAVPGSARGLYLVVSDIGAARAELVARGVDVSELSGERPKYRLNLATACRYDRWVAGGRLRTVISSIMRRRRGLISAI